MPEKHCYLVASIIRGTAEKRIFRLMRTIADTTERRTERNRTGLPPHLAWHPPFFADDTEIALPFLLPEKRPASAFSLQTGPLTAHHARFAYLPVVVDYDAQRFAGHVRTAIRHLKTYEVAPYEGPRRLHIPIASDLAVVFKRLAPRLRHLSREPMPIALEDISLFSRSAGTPWRRMTTVSLIQ